MAKRKNPHAVALGKKGGLIGGKKTSEAKRAAARKNGRKGGRPSLFVRAAKALASTSSGGSKDLELLASAMISDPAVAIVNIAESPELKDLGRKKYDFVAKAFGFTSFHDVIRQKQEANKVALR